MKTIDPRSAHALLEQGALLVDIRGADEHARERIPGACCIPLAQLASSPQLQQAGPGRAIVFHCRSGMRTRANAAALETASRGCSAYVAKVGRGRQIELYFIVPAGWPARALEEWDALRDEIGEAIGGDSPDRWLTIVFTTDREWAE